LLLLLKLFSVFVDLNEDIVLFPLLNFFSASVFSPYLNQNQSKPHSTWNTFPILTYLYELTSIGSNGIYWFPGHAYSVKTVLNLTNNSMELQGELAINLAQLVCLLLKVKALLSSRIPHFVIPFKLMYYTHY